MRSNAETLRGFWSKHYVAPNMCLVGVNVDHDQLTGFLEEVKERAKFHYWLFGHYHDNKIIDDRFVLLWEQMVQVV